MTAGLSPQGVASPQGVVECDLMVRARRGGGSGDPCLLSVRRRPVPVPADGAFLRQIGAEPLRAHPLRQIGAEPLRAHRRHRRAALARRGVNPNSGEPEGAMEQPRIAINRVFVDRERPSHLDPAGDRLTSDPVLLARCGRPGRSR